MLKIVNQRWKRNPPWRKWVTIPKEMRTDSAHIGTRSIQSRTSWKGWIENLIRLKPQRLSDWIERSSTLRRSSLNTWSTCG